MARMLSQCPVCDDRLEPVRLRCTSCGVTIEGKLPASRLSLLTTDQQRFVETFLVVRGNIKEAEKELGISYPTVRKKLEEVARTLGYPSEGERLQQHEVLDAIDRGDMGVSEGIAALRGQIG